MPISEIEYNNILALSYFLFVYIGLVGLSAAFSRTALVKRFLTSSSDRHGCVDGIRGVLALGVMCDHAFTGLVYFKTGSWHWATSPILNHLGDTTVGIFFIITGFLFTERACLGSFTWRGMYVSRAARIFPLYLMVVVFVAIAAFSLTGWTLHEPVMAIVSELFQWLCFGVPNINALPTTWTLIAGVNWTLKFEWGFYGLIFPALYVLSRFIKTRQMLVVFSAIVAIFVIIGLFHGQLARPWRSYLYFCCGIVGSLIYLEEPLIAVLRRPIVRNALALPIILLVFYVTDADAVPVLAAFSFFMAITAGFSFFGLLKTKAAIWLGDISYGIYLMHGAFLWITYYLIRSTGRLDSITVPYLFLLTLVVGIGVIAMASASYIFFERPIMRWAKGLTAPAS